MRGRDYALPQDVQDIAADVLRHRLVLSYDALADDIPADHVVGRIMSAVPMPSVSPRQGANTNGAQPNGSVPALAPASGAAPGGQLPYGADQQPPPAGWPGHP